MLNWMSGKKTDEIVNNRASSLCGYLWKMKSTKQKNILIPQWNKRWFSIGLFVRSSECDTCFC
jgi:hypothetical protein